MYVCTESGNTFSMTVSKRYLPPGTTVQLFTICPLQKRIGRFGQMICTCWILEDCTSKSEINPLITNNDEPIDYRCIKSVSLIFVQNEISTEMEQPTSLEQYIWECPPHIRKTVTQEFWKGKLRLPELSSLVEWWVPGWIVSQGNWNWKIFRIKLHDCRPLIKLNYVISCFMQ